MDYKTIEKLADYGFHFARTSPGMTRSNMAGWQDFATDDKTQLKEWHEAGYSFTSVAKRCHGLLIDIDDPVACMAKGFKLEWLTGYFGVNTPSGGCHYYGLQDDTTANFKGIVDIYRVRGDRKSDKVLELKLDKASVAAPTVERKGQHGKCDGVYAPMSPVNGRPKKGLDPAFKAWIIANAESVKKKTKNPNFSGFHPNFDLDRFLEEQACVEYKSESVEGALHVVVEMCPHCKKPAKKTTVRGGRTKFLFGGNSYGFICHACGVNTKAQHEELMSQKHPNYKSWDNYCIYMDDDDKFEFEKPGIEAAAKSEEKNNIKAEQQFEEPPRHIVVVRRSTPEYTYEPQDTGNGERLVRKFGEIIRWISETNDWMVWNDNGWHSDSTGTLMRMSKDIVAELVEEARTMLGNAIKSSVSLDSEVIKEAKAMLSHAKNTGRIERRRAMIASAGFEKEIHTNLSDWDANGWLLNVKNGVIDLRTQKFRERTKADLCIKQCPVVWDADAKCPLWEAAMLKWACNDGTWVTYLQQAFGISLTSDVSLQALFFCQGGGSNGKDTFFSILRNVLGSYCQDVSFSTFAETKSHSEHRNDLAALAGATRVITIAESSEGHTLDEGTIKLVTGGNDSKVTCRQIYGRPFNYSPQFTPWLMSNYEPVIKGGDWGIWRRVKKVPWDYTLLNGEKDQDFGAKLKTEVSGILNWALVGLHDLLAADKHLPACKRIEDATSEYRKEMDIIGRFVQERCQFEPCLRLRAKDLYKNYELWAEENGNFPINFRKFHAEFKKHEGNRIKWHDDAKGLVYEGVAMNVKPSEVGDAD